MNSFIKDFVYLMLRDPQPRSTFVVNAVKLSLECDFHKSIYITSRIVRLLPQRPRNYYDAMLDRELQGKWYRGIVIGFIPSREFPTFSITEFKQVRSFT